MIVMKRWFENKALTQQEKQAMDSGYTIEINKETEKAYQFVITTDFGKIYKWAPKSACTTMKERAAEERQGREAAHSRYDQLLNLAKENGLKVRKFMKLETIKSRLDAANIKY